MQPIKIEKRIMTEVESLRKYSALLPPGASRAMQNKLARIGKYAKKAQAMVEAPPASGLAGRPVHARYDMRDNEDIANTYAQRKRMWAELLAGKVISVETDADRIGTCAFASRISEIRKEIRVENKPYILCDQWVIPGGGRSKYKKYWLIDKTNN